LATNPAGLKDLFTNATSGLAVELDSFLTDTIGTAGASADGTITTDGSLVTHQANLTKQSAAIDTQISNIETQVQAYQTSMDNEFVAMETAESKTNQQMAYLTQAFSGSSSSG
jgi:flagellar capping protein FliD